MQAAMQTMEIDLTWCMEHTYTVTVILLQFEELSIHLPQIDWTMYITRIGPDLTKSIYIMYVPNVTELSCRSELCK